MTTRIIPHKIDTIPERTKAMIDAHTFTQNYVFEFPDGGSHTPTDSERAMLEDAINGYIAENEKAVSAKKACGAIRLLAEMGYAISIGPGINYNAEASNGCIAESERCQANQSAPPLPASHNSGGRLPSSDAAVGGADTVPAEQICDVIRLLDRWGYFVRFKNEQAQNQGV